MGPKGRVHWGATVLRWTRTLDLRTPFLLSSLMWRGICENSV